MYVVNDNPLISLVLCKIIFFVGGPTATLTRFAYPHHPSVPNQSAHVVNPSVVRPT